MEQKIKEQFGLDRTDCGLHLEVERQKLHHLREYNRLSNRQAWVTAYDLWEQFNWHYFNGVLFTPLIDVGITPYSGSSGYHCSRTNTITLHKSLGYSQGTLQHEMGHQWQTQIGEKLFTGVGHDDSHWNQSWLAFCTLTDLIDGTERELFYKKKSMRSVKGKRSKVWNWYDLYNEKRMTTSVDEDSVSNLSGYHSRILDPLRIW